MDPILKDLKDNALIKKLGEGSPGLAVTLGSDLGMPDEEIMRVLGVSARTVKKKTDQSTASKIMGLSPDEIRRDFAIRSIRRHFMRLRLISERIERDMARGADTADGEKEMRTEEKHVIALLQDLGIIPRQAQKLDIDTKTTNVLEIAVKELEVLSSPSGQLYDDSEYALLPLPASLNNENEDDDDDDDDAEESE